jgi:hypothetical protein
VTRLLAALALVALPGCLAEYAVGAADEVPCADGCDADREQCVAGVCACREGLERCGGACVDPRADAAHCGACDRPCADACEAGACVSDCAADRTECDGACVDPSSDALHCGGCGKACAADRVCLGGECRAYTELPGCDRCPCDACGGEAEGEAEDEGEAEGEAEDGGDPTESGGVCCDAPFLGAPVCVQEGCT